MREFHHHYHHRFPFDMEHNGGLDTNPMEKNPKVMDLFCLQIKSG